MDALLRFPQAYPQRAGDRFRANELVCVANQPLRPNDDAIVVPADNPENAQSVLSAISASTAQRRGSFAIRAAGSGLPGKFAEGMSKARSAYVAELKVLHDTWVSEGRQVSEAVASRFVVARNLVKDMVRAESPLPSVVYKVADEVRERLPRKGWTPTEKIFWGETESAIRSSFKSNKNANLLAITVGGPVAALLRTGGYMVVATDLTSSAVRLYQANTKDEQQAALENFGRSAGAAAGMAVGGMLCGAMGLTTGGLGFLGCAALTGATSFAMEETGAWLLGGALANDIASRVRRP